jgi:hypothetical protein
MELEAEREKKHMLYDENKLHSVCDRVCGLFLSSTV